MISESYRTKQYCCEDLSKVENYAQALADTSQIWDCHHKLEIQGQFINDSKLMKKCGLYYNVPAWQLVFIPHSDHIALHNQFRSEKTLSKKSNSVKGSNNPFFGKNHTSDTRKKISEAIKGRHWYNDGVEEVQASKCPEGFVKGRIKR